jgi:hypothetical protein
LRIILAQYYKSFNNNSFHTIHAPARFEPESTGDPTATHHLNLPGPRYQRVATQIPICLASEISEIPPMDQKLSMEQDLPPGLRLAGPSVQKIPKKFHQIAQNKQEKIVKTRLKITSVLTRVYVYQFVHKAQNCGEY